MPNASHAALGSVADAEGLLREAQQRRHVSSTAMNAESSRSHMIIELHLERARRGAAATSSKLTMVDLAGSERVARSGAVGQQLQEANAINSSLTALVNVIQVLCSRRGFLVLIVPQALSQQHKHVPYRDSKLTQLLSDSLGGNSKTLMVLAGFMTPLIHCDHVYFS